MLHLGLLDDERRALYQTLVQSHRIQLDIALLNQDEQEITSLTAPINKVVSGSVQLDATASITRSLDLTVLDNHRKLRFERHSPAHGSVFADNFVSVRYEVYVPDTVVTLDGETIAGIGDWVSIPVFWGPLSAYARNGAEVSLEAQGKESLMLDPHFATHGYTIDRNTRLDDAIRHVAEKAGETRFALPDLDHKLNSARSVAGHSEPWLILTNAKNVPGFKKAKGIYDKPIPFPVDYKKSPVGGLVDGVPGHWGAFYDGRGRLCVRRLDRHSIHTFKEGRDLIAGSPPQISYDITAFRNYVKVKGGKPKGKKPAFGHAALPPANPMSPDALSRNGKPRYMTEFIEAENLKTDDECKDRAHEVLERLAQEGVDVEFSCLPFPLIEENDVITLKTSEFSIDFQIRQMTIPLTSDEAMTFGRHQKVSVGRRKTKKWRRRHGGGQAGPGGRGGHGGSGHHHHHK